MSNIKLREAFYAQPTLKVARELLGKVLVHHRPDGVTSGMIVEVEAYIGEDDPACHAAPGPTMRNAPLYGPPGIAYVYLNYGIHALVNAVTEADGHPAAVLLRALDPIDGIDLMRARRSKSTKGRRTRDLTELPVHGLCRGPGNLTMAMGITLDDNLTSLAGKRLYIEDCGLKVGEIASGPRIGIRVGTESPWRLFVAGHPAVSASNRSAAGPAAKPSRR